MKRQATLRVPVGSPEFLFPSRSQTGCDLGCRPECFPATGGRDSLQIPTWCVKWILQWGPEGDRKAALCGAAMSRLVRSVHTHPCFPRIKQRTWSEGSLGESTLVLFIFYSKNVCTANNELPFFFFFLENLRWSSFEALKFMNSVNGKHFSLTKQLLSL